MKVLKHIIIGISLITTSLLSEEVDMAKLNSFYKIETIDQTIPGFRIGFEKETGDQNFDKYIKEALKDKDFKLANYKLFEEKRLAKVPIDGGKETLSLMTPKYDEALQLFLLSAEKGNILSAYEGQKILEKYFMSMGPNKILENYLEKFSYILMKKGYCKGYLYSARSLFKEFNSDKKYIPDYEKIYNIADKGLSECNKNVDDFYISALKKDRIKAKTMISVVKAKKEAETRSVPSIPEKIKSSIIPTSPTTTPKN